MGGKFAAPPVLIANTAYWLCAHIEGSEAMLCYTAAGAVRQQADNFSVILTSSVANPTVITTATPHGLTTGLTTTIAGHVGSTPDINGAHVVTVLTADTFTIPVNVTVGGTGGTAAFVDPLPLSDPYGTPPSYSNNTCSIFVEDDAGGITGGRVVIQDNTIRI